MRKNIITKGFTLIELLVVMSIIGILATLIVANVNSARARARDAQRKSDLRNIQTALRMYYNDNGKYPEANGDDQIVGCGVSACAWEDPFQSDGTVYMSTLPGDPLPGWDPYEYSQSDDDTFTISACLENLSDDKCDGSCDSSDGCLYSIGS